MKVLVTGGAGYIGSHTVLELIAAGHHPVVFDNFINSSPTAVERLSEITGQAIPLIEGDLTDAEAVAAAFAQYDFEAVLHFAGLKAVGESVSVPLRYYRNNIEGSLVLFEEMQKRGVRRLIFSSSATVYGDPASVPINEKASTGPTNPYGQTKLMIEQVISDWAQSWPELSAVNLRYFNPVGAHESGRIGEDPQDIPNNLMPFVAQVAVGRREKLAVFGNDWPTADGTGVRDYIHVVDLAKGHVAALRAAQKREGVLTVNLGTGRGYSVLEMRDAFAAASGREIDFEFTPRRPGDIAVCFADTQFAEATLGWKAEFGISRMCEDAWRWQSQNPLGYADAATTETTGDDRSK